MSRRWARWLVLLLGSAAAGVAQAQSDDGLSFSASYTLLHDSNLFRLPDDVDPRLVLGRSSKAETVDAYALKLGYAKSYSLQRLAVQASVVDYRYRTFASLDLLAINYDASWRWALTPRLRGTLHAGRDENVSAFDDASVLTSGNRRVRSDEAFDAQYEVDGVWRVVAGLRRSEDRSEQPLLGADSYVSRTADAGLRYEAKSGSAATLKLRSASGRTLDDRVDLTALRDDRFRQVDLVAGLRWIVTAKTVIDAEAVHLERTHPRVPQRDYGGTNARVDLGWSATAKTQAMLRWSSDLSSYQTDNASYARTDRIGVGLTWLPTARTRLGLAANEARRRYLGPLPGATPDPRRDTTREMQVSLRWSIGRNFAVESTVQQSRRQVNLPGLDFSSTRFTLGVTAGL